MFLNVKYNSIDRAEKPSYQPVVWINKYLTSGKLLSHGLSDGTVGILFGDMSQLLILADQKCMKKKTLNCFVINFINIS